MPKYLFLQKYMLLFFIILCSCSFERTITIVSDPPEAVVFIDGEKMTSTPAKIPFDFYGTREITLIKKGYHIVNTLEKIEAPFYQVFPLDFFVEFLYPFPIKDNREFFYTLKPYTPVSQKDKKSLLDRATNFKTNNNKDSKK